MPDPRVCQIRSTLDRDGTAACLLEWGPVRALMTPEVVHNTARDLAAAAASAEIDVALVKAFRDDLGADGQMLGEILTLVRNRRGLRPGRVGLRIEAVAGARTGRPYVHIGRGSMRGELSPDEARQMAHLWTEAAAAAQIDERLRRALGKWDRLTPDEIEQLFIQVQQEGR